MERIVLIPISGSPGPEEQLSLAYSAISFYPVAFASVHVYDEVQDWMPVGAQDQMETMLRDGAVYVAAVRVVLRVSLN